VLGPQEQAVDSTNDIVFGRRLFVSANVSERGSSVPLRFAIRSLVWRGSVSAASRGQKQAIRDVQRWLDWLMASVEEGQGMAAKKSTSRKVAWQEFADIPVTTNDVETFLKREYSVEEVCTRAEEVLGMEYKIGLAWDSYAKNPVASITCLVPGDPNAGKTVTAHGPTWFDALSFVLYKHFDISGGVWADVERDELGAYH
jgi:hypothetical protein